MMYLNVEKVLKPYTTVLEIGCGDQPLIAGLASHKKLEFCRLVAIDFAPSVVATCKRKALTTSSSSTQDSKLSKCGLNQEYIEMDARSMNFMDQDFDFIVDKGTIDAMLCDEEKGMHNAAKIFMEVIRCLHNDGGQFMLISHMEVDSDELTQVLVEALTPALNTKSFLTWKLDAHILPQEDSATVYVLKSALRPQTRSITSANQDVSLSMKVHEY